jgi:hypothetical protein
MKKEIIYLALCIMGCQFFVTSLICSFIFQKLSFIANGESFANCVAYLYRFPLIIVIIVGLLMIFAGTAGLVLCVKKQIDFSNTKG